MSDVFRQPSLFYHLGVRESFDMANNVILYHDTDPDTALSLKVHTNTAESKLGRYRCHISIPPVAAERQRLLKLVISTLKYHTLFALPENCINPNKKRIVQKGIIFLLCETGSN